MSNLEEYKEFLGDLGFRESSGNPRKINEGGYIGLFQFGEAALKDIGIYTEEEEANEDYYTGPAIIEVDTKTTPYS